MPNPHSGAETDDLAIIHRIHTASSWSDALAARNEILLKYRGAARAVALRTVPLFQRRFFDDAEQEACCGLIESSVRFDPLRGVPFRAFAYRAMVNRVRDFLRLHANAVQSERLAKGLSKMRRFVREEDREIDETTDQQFSIGTGLPVRTVRQTRPWLAPGLPLDRGDCLTEYEIEPSLQTDSTASALFHYERADVAAKVRALVAALDSRDRHLVTRVFGLDGEEPATIAHATAALGVSAQRGSVRLRRALRILRAQWQD